MYIENAIITEEVYAKYRIWLIHRYFYVCNYNDSIDSTHSRLVYRNKLNIYPNSLIFQSFNVLHTTYLNLQCIGKKKVHQNIAKFPHKDHVESVIKLYTFGNDPTTVLIF